MVCFAGETQHAHRSVHTALRNGMPMAKNAKLKPGKYELQRPTPRRSYLCQNMDYVSLLCMLL